MMDTLEYQLDKEIIILLIKQMVKAEKYSKTSEAKEIITKTRNILKSFRKI